MAFVCTLLSLASLIAAVYAAQYPTSSTTYFSWQTTKALLTFGDSYTYTQGAHGRQNYSFIADALAPTYTPEQLLNNTIIQNQIGTSAGELFGFCRRRSAKLVELTNPRWTKLGRISDTVWTENRETVGMHSR